MQSNAQSASSPAVFGDHPAGKALTRIQAFVRKFNEVRPQRERFAKALGLDWTLAASGVDRPDDPEYFGKHAVNLPFFYGQLLKAAASGEPPVIKYPREAGPGQTLSGIPGPTESDAKLASWVEMFLTRIVHESGAVDEWADAIDDVLAWGPGVVAIGFDKNVVHPDIAQNTLRSVEDISLQAAGGDTVAKPGERHEEAAKRLREMVQMASEEDSGFVLTSQEAEWYLARAQSHDAMAVKEAEEPLPPAWDGHKIWARRCQVGVDVFWDSTVTRLEDARWMARRVEMTIEEFRASPLFKKSVRTKGEGGIKGVYPRGVTGLEGNTGEEESHHDAALVDDKVVVLYEIWVSRPELRSGGERHFVSPEMPDKFLESDSRNPYINEDGRPLIPGFYPIFASVPIQPPINDPLRTVGIPALAPGWPQVLEMNDLRTLSLDSARKHSKAVYVADRRLGGQRKIQRILAGPDAAVFMAPSGVRDATERKSLIVPIQFTGKNEELDRQVLRVEQDWRSIMGVAAAVYQGQGVSDTLGQDQIAQKAGASLQGLIIDSVQEAFAKMVEGMRGLARMYPIEMVVRYLGQAGAEAVMEWSRTSMDGDKMWVRFGSRAKAEEAVDRKQLMETIGLLEQKQDLGGPIYETEQYYEDLVRSQGLGKPEKVDPEQRQLRQLAAVAQALMEQYGQEEVIRMAQGGGSPGGGGSGGSPVRPSVSDSRGPSEQNIGSGARRGAASPNN